MKISLDKVFKFKEGEWVNVDGEVAIVIRGIYELKTNTEECIYYDLKTKNGQYYSVYEYKLTKLTRAQKLELL